MADRSSSAPQARTRLARRAVLDAAGTLFRERGYGATTIDAISRASDVPQATVYRLFSSKQGILKALVDASIAGDDEPVPLAERPPVRSLLSAPDPRRPTGSARSRQRRHQHQDRTDLRHPHQRRRLRPGSVSAPRRPHTATTAGPRPRRDLAGTLGSAAAPPASTRRRRHHPRTGITRALPPPRDRPPMDHEPLPRMVGRNARRTAALLA